MTGWKQRATARAAKNRRELTIEPSLTTCELAAYRVRRQEMTVKMMRNPGG
jgi:hypothetical protein